MFDEWFLPAWALSCAEITTKLDQLTQALDGTQTDPIEMMVEVIESSNKDAKAHGTRTEMDIACLGQKNIDTAIIEAARKGVIAPPHITQDTERAQKAAAGVLGLLKDGTVSAAGGQAIVLGALESSLIDKVIQQNVAQFLDCYQRALTKNPELKGKVTLNFTISKTGSVAKSSTYKTTLGNATAEACLNQNMMNLQFPEPKGGGIVIVKYPFIFSS